MGRSSSEKTTRIPTFRRWVRAFAWAMFVTAWYMGVKLIVFLTALIEIECDRLAR